MKIRRIEVATSDDRGSISDVFYDDSFQHAAIIVTRAEFEPVIRGNHYHKQSTQHILMLDGSLTYWWQQTNEQGERIGEIESIFVPTGYMVSSPPYEIHALEFHENARFIVFSKGVRGGKDYESDTFRVDPILTPDKLHR